MAKEKIDNCVKRSETTIKSKITINKQTIEMEQRMLSVVEVEEQRRGLVDITSDPELFKAIMLMNKDVNDEDEEVIIERTRLIRHATAGLEAQTLNKKIDGIAMSCKPNRFYGGYFKFNGESITDTNEMCEILKELDEDEIIKLYNNVERLINPTEDEVEEGK